MGAGPKGSSGTGMGMKAKTQSRPRRRGRGQAGREPVGVRRQQQQRRRKVGGPAPPRGGPSARPSPLPEGAGSPTAGRRRRGSAVAAAPSDCLVSARRREAGRVPGSPRGAASVAGPDRGGQRGWVGAAAAAGTATAAQTSSSGPARRPRKPPRGKWRLGQRAPPAGLSQAPGAGEHRQRVWACLFTAA